MLYLLFAVSVLATYLGLFLPGLAPLLLVTGPAAGLSLFLLLRGRRTRPGPPEDMRRVIVDGSNVMHWQGGVPDLAPVRDVIGALRQAGFDPGVVFDANAGYKLEGRYLRNAELAQRLRLPRENVMIVPRNTPADPMILAAARDYGAPVVTRDRFRDWTNEFPEISRAGFLISGRYDGADLRLNLPS